MERTKQRVRAATARKKEEERKAKGKDGASSLAPKAIPKGSTKRKTNGEDDRPPKKIAVTLGDAHPKKKSPFKSSHGTGKGVMTSFGPVIEEPCCLLTHKDYAVKEIKSLIKQTDIDPYTQLRTEDFGASALFDLTRALVHIKALQDRCVAKEGVVTRVRKHNTNLMNQHEQHKEALRTLNLELKKTREKLEGTGCQKAKLEEKLTTLRKQVKKAGTDAVEEFKASQSFINSCAEYYGIGFEDCLKQVALAFLELDLSGISMDDPIPMIPAGYIAVDDDDDFTELDPPPKDDGVVLAQPAANPPISSSNPSVELLDA